MPLHPRRRREPGRGKARIAELGFGLSRTREVFSARKDEDTWSVLPGVGSHVGQDGHLVDVGIILGIHALEFGVQCFVACVGQAGIAFGDLDEGIAFVEVGVVVITGEPGGSVVRDLVGLWGEGFVLNKTA